MPLEYPVKHVQEHVDNTPDGRSHTGDPVRIVMAGDHTNGSCTMIDVTVSHQNEPPLHLHTREDELLYVVEGEIDVSLDGTRSPLAAGEAIFLPRGQAHAYCLRSETARLVLVWTPAGIEGFYRELAEADMSGGYIERLIVLAARYGIVITGAPLREA